MRDTTDDLAYDDQYDDSDFRESGSCQSAPASGTGWWPTWLFLLIEAVRRKPVNREAEGMVTFAGLSLLMGLLVFVTFKDIRDCSENCGVEL